MCIPPVSIYLYSACPAVEGLTSVLLASSCVCHNFWVLIFNIHSCSSVQTSFISFHLGSEKFSVCPHCGVRWQLWWNIQDICSKGYTNFLGDVSLSLSPPWSTQEETSPSFNCLCCYKKNMHKSHLPLFSLAQSELVLLFCLSLKSAKISINTKWTCVLHVSCGFTLYIILESSFI